MNKPNSIHLAWGLANIPISVISDGLLIRISEGRSLSVGSTIRRGCYINGQFRVGLSCLYTPEGGKNSSHLLCHILGFVGVNTLVNRVTCIMHSGSQLVVIGSVRGVYTTVYKMETVRFDITC
jgi:hypothetical protein